jgi:hypothetical protein
MSKPAFDPNKPFDAKPEFDPSQPFEAVDSAPTPNAPQAPASPQISTGEALGRGFLDPASLGYYKSILAGAKTLQDRSKGDLNDLYDIYKKNLGQESEREKASFSQHPVAYGAGMAGSLFVNPAGDALEGAGLVGKLAEGASAGEKIAHGAKTGAIIGGIAGTGNSDKPLVEQNVGDVANSALGGGLIGGGIGAIGAGITGAAKMAASKEIPIVSDLARSHLLGQEGTMLFNSKKLADTVQDKAQALGETGLGDQIGAVGSAMEKAVADAAKEGKSIDYRSVLDQINKLETEVHGRGPSPIKDELQSLINHWRDTVQGNMQKRSINVLTKVGEETIPGEPTIQATPSTEESLQSQADKLNADELNNADVKGRPPKKYSVIKGKDGRITIGVQDSLEENTPVKTSETIKNANPTQKEINNYVKAMADNGVEISEQDAEARIKQLKTDAMREKIERKLKEQAFKADSPVVQNIKEGTGEFEGMLNGQSTPIPEVQPNTPSINPLKSNAWQESKPGTPFQQGTPDQVKSIYEPQEQTFSERSNPDAQMNPVDAKAAQKSVFGQNFQTPEAQKNQSDIYHAMGNQFNESVPGYKPLSDQYRAFSSAMDDLGIKFKGPESTFFKQSPEEVLSGAKTSSQFDPDVAAKLKSVIEKSLSDPATKQNVDNAFAKLNGAGFQGMDELRANLTKAIKNEQLSKGLPSGRSLISPIGSPYYKALKAGNLISNVAGVAQAPVEAAAQNILPRTNLAGKLGNAVSSSILPEAHAESQSLLPNVKEDFLGNKITDSKDEPEDFGRKLYSASDPQLLQIAQALHGSPFEHLGAELAKAVQEKNVPKRNALQFIMATNPRVREALQGPAVQSSHPGNKDTRRTGI